MMSLTTLFLSASLAVAGPSEDLSLAADDSQVEDVRMDAFFRLVRLGASDLNPLLEVAKSAETPMEQRWIAIRVLGRLDGSTVRSTLIELSQDSSAPVRAAAIEALGDQGRKDTVQSIIPALQDPAIIVRVSAATALASLRSSEAIEALDDALQDQSNYRRGQSLWVRRYFVLAIGAIGDDAAYPVLLRTLNDSDQRVVDQTIDALEKIAGFSFAEGREPEEERQAWVRWTQSRIP